MSGNTLRGTPNRGQSRPGIPFATSPGPGSSSSIPRPVLETHPSTTASDSGAAPAGGAAGAASAVSASRQKQIKRDDAIRRKMESDLSKKKHLSGRARHTRKAPPGTVLALKPSPALQIKPGTTVAEAAQLMAAKREDCVLVTDDDDRISGIFTAKDLAFRVVGAGMKPTHITIAEIMTKNPLCARTDTSATDALDLMAAQLMKENRTTAVLVQDQGAITGIFTSKDVVLRVIAVGLDPATCSVVRVMTPHPDFASMDMSIQAALRKMHDGHYLNLPVMNDGGEIVGMVDVLKLTYATLEQINTMATGDNEGPAWNKFWLSLDNESESMVSGEGSHHHTNLGSRIMSPDHTRERIGDSVAPGDSASHVGVESPPHSEFIPADSIAPQSPAELPFPFKFKAPSGRVHRLQVIASQGVAAMVANVVAKLGAEAEAIGGPPMTDDDGKISGGFALSYLDDEGDSVSITTDNDLLESILLARQGHREKVDLFVHDPEKPPVAVAPTPVEPVIPTPATSTASGLRERRKAHDDEDDEDEEEEDESPSRRSRRSRHAAPQQEQLIQGVPNDLLLPGAIVTLAVVIVGVFTISRITSR
ncbi:CBS domain-containing protein CBSCBSPB3 like [Verticillium longisporum]|uniref:CBS domain-containing protein CBSCBSPB3 like n=1 Tax=Verticillium longisporum TaxID=100787 RepID=A0A8I2ZXP5_VERLO|nr:CBS domain-containing protein CBSCBSPB3 like [Verticillium longisporum]